MVFCNYDTDALGENKDLVTILILIDGFLQFGHEHDERYYTESHNPYFNRWFSAI